MVDSCSASSSISFNVQQSRGDDDANSRLHPADWQISGHQHMSLQESDIPTQLGILRGAVYLLVKLLPPIDDSPITHNDDVPLTGFDESLLSEMISLVGDWLVVIDSLLQAHLAARGPAGPRRKAPSLMDSMVCSAPA